MAQYADLPLWDTSYAEICARIEKYRASIKILLKTKNDPFFVDRWIAHHLRIVGPENLIIFDNMSDDQRVLSVYEKYRFDIQIVRFSALWFSIHHTYLFRHLYRALANSCEYFLFLDTDEFLILTNGKEYFSDSRIVEFVDANGPLDLFPATCLPNADWKSERYKCGADASDLAENLARGKPLLRTSSIPLGFVNHTFQLGNRVFAPPFMANLFLLHLSRLNPKQRMSANVNKLIAAGLVGSDEEIDSILARKDITEETMSGYVNEIRDCLAAERAVPHEVPLGPGCLELSTGGTISYYSDIERALLTSYIADPRPIYKAIGGGYRLAEIVASDIGRPELLGKLYP